MNTLTLYRWMALPRKLEWQTLRRPGAGRAADQGHRVTRVRLPLLRRIARCLFRDMTLERRGTRVHVIRGTQVPGIATTATADDSLDARESRAALKTLLDAHPMTRRVMRHLAFVDRALAVQGFAALVELPVEVLSMAVEQFEVLVSNWSNPQLAALRSKMAVAIVDRSHDPFYGRAGDKLSNFNTDSRLLVGDASHSMFLELERQYQHVLPAPSIRATLDRIGGVAKASGLPARIASDRIPTLHDGSRP